ncbi:MAG: acyl carrier protein [Terriglobales bacterium]
MQQLEQEVRQFIIDNFVFENSNGSFSNEDSFLETGLVDSMSIMTLVEFVREKYAISIEDEELVPDHWDSVSRIACFVQSRLGLVEASQQNVSDGA